MWDNIEQKLKGAEVREVLELTCCLSSTCVKAAAGAIHLAFKDGRNDIFMGCPEHLEEFEKAHPRAFGGRRKQSFFVL